MKGDLGGWIFPFVTLQNCSKERRKERWGEGKREREEREKISRSQRLCLKIHGPSLWNPLNKRALVARINLELNFCLFQVTVPYPSECQPRTDGGRVMYVSGFGVALPGINHLSLHLSLSPELAGTGENMRN